MSDEDLEKLLEGSENSEMDAEDENKDGETVVMSNN